MSAGAGGSTVRLGEEDLQRVLEFVAGRMDPRRPLLAGDEDEAAPAYRS